MAEVAYFLNTPIPSLLEMDWTDLIEWHAEARAIAQVLSQKRA